MKRRRSRLRLFAIVTAVLVVVVIAVVGIAMSFATPIRRTNIASPLYTVGDANYAEAMRQELSIVKLGRMPLGIYSGGVAFDTAADAHAYLREIEEDGNGWGVYRLSGDFELDTYESGGRRYTDKSLVVLERVHEESESAESNSMESVSDESPTD